MASSDLDGTDGTAASCPVPPADDCAICVDLDGTLLRSDLLLESVLVLLGRNPLYVFLLPLWLLQGKAALKHEIAQRVALRAETLPYDERVLQFLRETQGRPRVLCTASDGRFAQSVADHLGVFEQVLASDGVRNLSGRTKAEALVERFGDRKFDYLGNDKVDLHVWSKARSGWVVNANRRLAQSMEKRCQLQAHWPKSGNGVSTWLRALRVHQWLKNLLVFVPLLAAHRLFEPSALWAASSAFFAFGLCASGVYLLNDLLDLTADRLHPRKRRRPFASGDLPLLHGVIAAPLLTLGGFALALWCSPFFALVLAVYYVATLAYSFRLKRIVMVDVVLLAGLYTVRIIGGAVAIDAELSFWLLAFSMFLFLSLAMLKRYTELQTMLAEGKADASGRGYRVDDLTIVQSLGGACGFIAVLVLCLYINSQAAALYRNPQMLWLLCPLLLYWVSRAWLLAHRNEMHDDPIVFAAGDKISLIVLFLSGAAFAAAL